MIKKIKLINFRNFEEIVLDNIEEKNFYVGPNGIGKTNILESIALISHNSLLKLDLKNLVNFGGDYFFIEIHSTDGKILSFYYSLKDQKKNFMINSKKVSSKNFYNESFVSVAFSPINMNMFYLSPSLRRDYLDDALKSSFSEYEKLLKEYKNILKHRNSVLKAINEGRVSKTDIEYWTTEFIKKAIEIYSYRFMFFDFLKENINSIKDYFVGKNISIDIVYLTKIDRNNIERSIKEYLDKNLDRDIILQKTHIGAHLDDLDILLNGVSITNFASRGETKSIIIFLKILEAKFLEKITGKKPLIIIDDLFSELDEIHKTTILSYLNPYQIFVSSIQEEKGFNNIMI